MKDKLFNKLFGLTVGALLAAVPFNSFADNHAEAPDQADQGCSGEEGCNAEEACSGEEGCSGKEAAPSAEPTQAATEAAKPATEK